MPDWLQSTFQSDLDLSLTTLTARMAASLVLGCVVAGIYRVTHGRPGSQSLGLMATLVLLTVLIAMVTLVIGNNVARAFSLVGALAIVRFRTVVEDTRDTAFVIFAVSVGMAVGAGYMKVPLVGIPTAALGAWLFRPRRGWRPGPLKFDLSVRIGAGHSSTEPLEGVLASHTGSARLTGIATARQGAAFERTYAVRLRRPEDASALVDHLHRLEGVQAVELRGA